MKKYSIQVPYIISDFKDHQKVKQKLMEMLDEQNYTSSKQECEKYQKSDWYVDAGVMREYWKFLYPSLTKHMNPIFNDLCPNEEYSYTNEWFIKYGENGYLDWHRHQEQYWASIYYVHFPKGASKTLLKSPFDGSVIEPDIKEGQVLTFPGLVEHCSKPCKTEKIVISFNIR